MNQEPQLRPSAKASAAAVAATDPNRAAKRPLITAEGEESENDESEVVEMVAVDVDGNFITKTTTVNAAASALPAGGGGSSGQAPSSTAASTNPALSSCASRFRYYFAYKAPGRKSLTGHMEADSLGNWLAFTALYVILGPVLFGCHIKMLQLVSKLREFEGKTGEPQSVLIGLSIGSFLALVTFIICKLLAVALFSNDSHAGLGSRRFKSVTGLNIADALLEGGHLALLIETLVALEVVNRWAYLVFAIWLLHRGFYWISQRGQYSVFFFLVLFDALFYATFVFPIAGVTVYHMNAYVDAVTAGTPSSGPGVDYSDQFSPGSSPTPSFTPEVAKYFQLLQKMQYKAM